MKFQKSTLSLLFLAIILGGYIYFYEIKLESQKIIIEEQENKIFKFEVENIQKITILNSHQTSLQERYPKFLELVKNQNNPGSWSMKQPEKLTINGGVISFLLNLIEQGTRERKLLITQEQLSQYELQPPLATIIIKLKNQQIYQILLGKETINPNIIYAQIHTPEVKTTTTEVLLVSKNWHYAVMRELKEWQNIN